MMARSTVMLNPLKMLSHEIVGQRAFLGRIAQEHADDRPHVVLDLDDEDLLVVADEDGAPAIGGQDAPNLEPALLRSSCRHSSARI